MNMGENLELASSEILIGSHWGPSGCELDDKTARVIIFGTEATETPPSPESRLRAIDGSETTPDFKPAA